MSTKDRLSDRRTLAVWLADQIREDIITQTYAPGQALREKELADRFQVSRIPLREALRRLEAESYVTIQPYRGAIVTRLSAIDGVEIAEMRSALMQLAVRQALPRIADADLLRLNELLSAMTIEADAHRWSRLISEFHTILFAVPDRPILMGHLRTLQTRSRRYHMYIYRNVHLRRLAERCLRDLSIACNNRNPEHAVRLVADYFDTLIRNFRAESAPASGDDDAAP